MACNESTTISFVLYLYVYVDWFRVLSMNKIWACDWLIDWSMRLCSRVSVHVSKSLLDSFRRTPIKTHTRIRVCARACVRVFDILILHLRPRSVLSTLACSVCLVRHTIKALILLPTRSAHAELVSRSDISRSDSQTRSKKLHASRLV